MIPWLAQANWPNLVAPGWAVVPDEVYFGQHIYVCSYICCIWHINALLAIEVHSGTLCLLGQTYIDTLQYIGEAIGKSAQNYVDTILSVGYEYFVAMHTFAWLLWCSMNKLSSFALQSIALQYWGKLCS